MAFCSRERLRLYVFCTLLLVAIFCLINREFPYSPRQREAPLVAKCRYIIGRALHPLPYVAFFLSSASFLPKYQPCILTILPLSRFRLSSSFTPNPFYNGFTGSIVIQAPSKVKIVYAIHTIPGFDLNAVPCT